MAGLDEANTRRRLAREKAALDEIETGAAADIAHDCGSGPLQQTSLRLFWSSSRLIMRSHQFSLLSDALLALV